MSEPEPWGMLDEAPLAERYDEDIVYVAARDPETLYIYWEITAAARARLRPIAGDGRATVRLVTVGHGPHGTETQGATMDLLLDSDVGSSYLPWQAMSGDILRVRALLGLTTATGTFVPLTESPLSAVPPIGPADPGAPRPIASVGHSPRRPPEKV